MSDLSLSLLLAPQTHNLNEAHFCRGSNEALDMESLVMDLITLSLVSVMVSVLDS